MLYLTTAFGNYNLINTNYKVTVFSGLSGYGATCYIANPNFNFNEVDSNSVLQFDDKEIKILKANKGNDGVLLGGDYTNLLNEYKGIEIKKGDSITSALSKQGIPCEAVGDDSSLYGFQYPTLERLGNILDDCVYKSGLKWSYNKTIQILGRDREAVAVDIKDYIEKSIIRKPNKINTLNRLKGVGGDTTEGYRIKCYPNDNISIFSLISVGDNTLGEVYNMTEIIDGEHYFKLDVF